MRLTNNILKAAVAATCLAIAACGGDSTADSQSSHEGSVPTATVLKAAAGQASPNGTSIPSATQIIDSGDNVWTVAAGVIYENGASAGYSKNVTQLLYVGNTIYQENAAGGWWSWNGSTWVGKNDPRNALSAGGTTIPGATQIIDSSGNIWAVVGGVIYENGKLAGYSRAVTRLVYDNNTVYQENAAGGWWSWSNGTWASSGPAGNTTPTAPTGSLSIAGNPDTSDAAGQAYIFVPTTSNTDGGTLTFSIANKPSWASFNAATGELTGTPGSAQAGTYSDIILSVSNGTESASLPAFSIVISMGSATLSWNAPTQNTDGTPLTDLAGYTIYYGPDPSDMTKTIRVATPNTTTYEVSNLPAGTYYFAVAAYSSLGTRSNESPVGYKTIM